MSKAVITFFVLIFFSVSFLGGCASKPIPSSYSEDVPTLSKGSYLEKVWFDKNSLSKIQYSEVRLISARDINVEDQKNVSITEAIQWLKDATIEPGKDNLVLQTNNPGQKTNLDLAITELNPGSTIARFWAGELGAGHAWVQVEGKLVDVKTQKLLGYFVERERKSGVATFRNSRGYDSGPGLIHDIINNIGIKIRKEIAQELKIKI